MIRLKNNYPCGNCHKAFKIINDIGSHLNEIFGMRQSGNSVWDFVFWFPFYQQQGIERHGKAAKKHGRGGDDGVQEAGGRHRDADDIIADIPHPQN